MSAPAIDRRIWAPIRINTKGRPDWPIYGFLSYSRRDAKAAFLEFYSYMDRPEDALKGVRFARVEVKEIVA